MLHPMLLTDAPTAFNDPNWLWEMKFDGIRCLAVIHAGDVQLLTRRCKDMTAQFPEVSTALRTLIAGQPAILDGELICPAADGRPDFFPVIRRLGLSDPVRITRAAVGHPACLLVFDVLELGGTRLTAKPLEERKAILAAALPPSPTVQVVPTWPGTAGCTLAETVAARDLEGLVAKRLGSPYRPGARSRDWIKVKQWKQAELTLLAVRHKPFGCLVGQPGGPPLGVVELGWQAEDMQVIMRLLPDLKNREAGGLIWLKPYLRLQIRHRTTPQGQLREAVFAGFALP